MSDSKFECLNKHCSIKGNDERMVCCWLCLGLCHFKCSGLRTLVAEALQNTKGLKWCCPDCSQIDAEFYRFYQSTKDTFISLQSKMSALSNELAAYGKLFDDFKKLKALRSPEPSPKRRKSARNKNKSNNEPVTQTALPVSLIETIQDTNNMVISSPSLISVNPNLNEGKESSANPVPGLKSSTINTRNTTDTNKLNFDPVPSTSSITSKAGDSTQNVPDQLQETVSYSQALKSNVRDVNINLPQSSPKPLRVIPPARSIFISRLASETTVNDIEYYIRSKLGKNCNLSVFKYTYAQPRTITSFKITVPNEFFDHILDSNFWPTSTFVREFVLTEKRRNTARLPVSRPETSKN